jgi:hypothetical protein
MDLPLIRNTTLLIGESQYTVTDLLQGNTIVLMIKEDSETVFGMVASQDGAHLRLTEKRWQVVEFELEIPVFLLTLPESFQETLTIISFFNILEGINVALLGPNHILFSFNDENARKNVFFFLEMLLLPPFGVMAMENSVLDLETAVVQMRKQVDTDFFLRLYVVRLPTTAAPVTVLTFLLRDMTSELSAQLQLQQPLLFAQPSEAFVPVVICRQGHCAEFMEALMCRHAGWGVIMALTSKPLSILTASSSLFSTDTGDEEEEQLGLVREGNTRAAVSFDNIVDFMRREGSHMSRVLDPLLRISAILNVFFSS